MKRWGSALAWFGSTLGSSCWLVIAAIVLPLEGHPGVALVCALAFLVPLLVAARLWQRRDRFGPEAATEAWFVVLWAMTAVALAAVHVGGAYASIRIDPEDAGLIWLGVALGGLLLWLSLRRRRKGAADDGTPGALLDVFAALL